MAKYWARIGSGIDMSTVDLSDVVRGRGVTVNEHTLRINHGDGYATTIKGDFDLNGKGFATSGTITRITFEDDDHYGTTLSGLRLDLSAFTKAAKSASTADDGKLFASIFAKNDALNGDSSEDTLKGFAGDDALSGGMGADILAGGDGADIFNYGSYSDSTEGLGVDTITDFSQSDGDKINLRSLGFLDFETDIRISARGNDTAIEIDVPNGVDFEMVIRVLGTVAFSEADFLL